jgi:HK97 gp10 family phage protein
MLKFHLEVEKITTFTAELRVAVEESLRPVAQAGAQVFYSAVKDNPNFPRSERMHYFYGTAAKAMPPGLKKQFRYGPFYPGNLQAAVYQAFAKERSTRKEQVYNVSWNRKKAPYGHMVEYGTSRAPAHPFILPAAAFEPMAIDAMEAKWDTEMTARGFT